MSDEFKLDFQPTPRGFPRAEFRDRQGGKCSIQESSLAGEDCIWLGMDEGTHVDGECLARMHLNREQSGVISCLLAGFAETGEVGRESTRITELEAQLAQAKAAKEIAECAAYQYSTNIAGFELAAKKAEAECNTASARVKELDYALGVALTDCKRFLAEREAAVKAKEAAEGLLKESLSKNYELIKLNGRRFDEKERLRAALEQVEWIHNYSEVLICAWCKGYKHGDGHKPDCARQAALTPEKKEGE